MQIESIGHESWLLKMSEGITLIDPLLRQVFGNSNIYEFKKLSHRDLSIYEINLVTNVLLTTEYFQHFDKKSIEMLDKSVTIFISPTFSADDASWIEARGHKVIRPRYGEIFIADGLECFYLPSSPSTVKWDIRVSSLAVGYAFEKSVKWMFFQSDTAASPNILKYLPEHWPKKADLVAVTSHWKQYEVPGFSSWDNLIAPPASIADPRNAMFVASSILPLKIYPLNIARRYAVCGGDYVKADRPLPKPVSDNASLAEMAQALALNAEIFHARAGTSIDLINDTVMQRQLEGGPIAESAIEPFTVAEPFADWNGIVDDRDLELALERFGRALLLSELGRHLLFSDEYLGRPLNARRFALMLIHAEGHTAYEFCFASGKFIICESGIDDLIDLPAGLVIARSALLHSERGESSPAEACSFNAVHWTTGPVSTAPLGLLYSTFGFATCL